MQPHRFEFALRIFLYGLLIPRFTYTNQSRISLSNKKCSEHIETSLSCRCYLYCLSHIWLTLKPQFLSPCHQTASLFFHWEDSFEIKAPSLGMYVTAIARQLRRVGRCGGGLLLWKREEAGTMLSHGELQLPPPLLPPSYVAYSSADPRWRNWTRVREFLLLHVCVISWH